MCAVFSSARIQSTAPGHVSEGAGTTAELLLLRASVTGAAGPGATRHQQPAAGCSSELSEDSVQPGASPPPLSRLTTWPPTAWTSDLRCCRAPAPRTRPPPSPRTCRIQVPEVNTRHVTLEPACWIIFFWGVSSLCVNTKLQQAKTRRSESDGKVELPLWELE